MRHRLIRNSRQALQAVAAVAAITAASAPAAHAACASTPANLSFADPYGDSDYALAPEAVSMSVSLNDTCDATVGYGILNQDALVSGDSLFWFVDVDGNAATGATGGYTGADIGIVRNSSTGIVSRYDPVAGAFSGAEPITLTGNFGASFNLSRFTALGNRQMTFAGSTWWKSSSTGTTYYDWVPEPGLAPFSAAISLSEPVPAPTPAPLVVAPAPTPAPIAAQPATAPAATQPAPPVDFADSDFCEVPRSKNLHLAEVKARIRSAGCEVGRLRHRTSTTIKSGRVIGLSEHAGEFVDRGTRLQITVSSGRPSKAKRLGVAEKSTGLVDSLNAAAGL